MIPCNHRTRQVDQHIQQVGKHRSIWEREPKPAGFWDSDFPTTQQLNNHREEGERKNAERLRQVAEEALTGKGRWKKRDTKQ